MRREAEGQVLGGVEQEGGAQTSGLAPVDVFFARGGVVDIAAFVAHQAADAKRCLVAERNVGDGAHRVAGFAVLGRFRRSARTRFERVRRRCGGDELDEAAQRACAVERALRTAQHFDALHVERIEVERQLRGVDKRGAGAERGFIDISANGAGDAAGVEAAQRKTLVARLPAGGGEARNVGDVIVEAVRLDAFQRLAGHRGDGLRHFAQKLFALLRGDDDLAIVGNFLRLSCRKRQHRSGRNEREREPEHGTSPCAAECSPALTGA